MSSICDERGEELLYAGIPISRVLQEEMGIGGVLSLLWFQKRLPSYVNKFIEICLILTDRFLIQYVKTISYIYTYHIYFT
jgi:ATP citrate (pro-S)-lyase